MATFLNKSLLISILISSSSILSSCSQMQQQLDDYKKTAQTQKHQYLKIDEKGQVLPDDAKEWSCVFDSKTNLLWEEKTDDGGLRDKDWLYTWYKPPLFGDENPAINGYVDIFDAGVLEMSIGGIINHVQFNQYFTFTHSGQSAGGTLPKANTHEYLKAVNQMNLCGISNWRIPDNEEFKSLFRTHRGINQEDKTQYFYDVYAFDDKQNFIDTVKGRNTIAFLDIKYFNYQPFFTVLWGEWIGGPDMRESRPFAEYGIHGVGSREEKTTAKTSAADKLADVHALMARGLWSIRAVAGSELK